MNDQALSGTVAAFSWALVHSLWQGLVAAGFLWLILRLLPTSGAKLRYAAALSALALVTLAFGLTLVLQNNPPPIRREPSSGKTPELSGKSPGIAFGISAGNQPVQSWENPGNSPQRKALSAPAATQYPDPPARPVLSSWMPWLVSCWGLGLLLRSLRLLGEWRTLRRWRIQAETCRDPAWLTRFDRLRGRLGLSRPLRLLTSAAAPVPLVIGWLRPAVLVPLQLFTGLPAGQLEALLAHELAHIRRQDWLVNLLQSAMEIIFFHHPAVWWISSQIRTEREHCCDDAALRLCGGPLPYARALAALEDLRKTDAPALCPAAAGSPLGRRIRRLVTANPPYPAAPLWPALLGTMALLVVLCGLPWLQAQEKTESPPPLPAAQGTKSEKPAIIPDSAHLPPSPSAAEKTPDTGTGQTRPNLTASLDIEAEARKTVMAFLQAPTAEEKMRWLIPEREGLESAKAFFRRHPSAASAMAGQTFLDSFPGISINEKGQAFLTIAIPELRGCRLFRVDPTKQGPRIDWLSCTFYLQTRFEDIQEDMPETPTKLGVTVRAGDYYNKAFADKTRYRCYELRFPGVDRRFYGYEERSAAEKESREPEPGDRVPLFEKMDGSLTAGIQLLEIKYPSTLKDPVQVKILRVLPKPEAGGAASPPAGQPLKSRWKWDQRLSDFRSGRQDFSPGIPDPPRATLRDFGETAFDNVGLIPATTPEVAPEITVSVIKAGSRTRMPAFSVFLGRREGDGEIFWIPMPQMNGEGGECSLPRTILPAQGSLRIEAEGRIPKDYTWENSKTVPNTLSFELETDAGTESVASLPDGSPAAGATVALALPGRYAILENGQLRGQDKTPSGDPAGFFNLPWQKPRISQADARGHFLLPTEIDLNAVVLVIHEAGTLEIPYADFVHHPEARLQPWAKVRGRVRWGDQPGASTTVTLSSGSDPIPVARTVIEDERTITDAEGYFVFPKVLPGNIRVACPLSAGPESPYPTEINLTGRETLAQAVSGENLLLIGGAGRRLTGRLTGRDSWDGVTFAIAPQDPPQSNVMDNIRRRAWENFRDRPEAALFFRSGLKLAVDGTFDLQGILPGSYQISVSAAGKDEKPLRAGGTILIPPEIPGVAPSAMDAGPLPLVIPPSSAPK